MILLLTQIAADDGRLTLDSMCQRIVDKMIERRWGRIVGSLNAASTRSDGGADEEPEPESWHWN